MEITKDKNISNDSKSTESNVRYVAYSRFLLRMSRYLAFTSDVGEAFRPIVNQRLVQLSYGISWAYVIGDVSYEAKKEIDKGSSREQVKFVVAERATF